jgi:hypothetical protein
MAKRANGSEPQKDRREIGEASPPLLSEKLIAQLQGAVNAARSRRMRLRDDATSRLTPQKRAPRWHTNGPVGGDKKSEDIEDG